VNTPVSVEFLDKFAAAWNEHDVNAIVSMMTPDAVMFMSAGPNSDGRRINGRDELRTAISSLFETMPDAQWRDAKHFLAGDRGVTQWTFTATRPDGSKIVSVGCDVFIFRDGRIAVKDSYRKQPTF
jgi:ketosteroid isomerase-like protein